MAAVGFGIHCSSENAKITPCNTAKAAKTVQYLPSLFASAKDWPTITMTEKDMPMSQP